MYCKEDIQFVGKFDYDKESSEGFASLGIKTFSVNIFKCGIKKNGKELKPLKCVVRISGNVENKDKVFNFCEYVVKSLDNNNWDGRKNVFVR